MLDETVEIVEELSALLLVEDDPGVAEALAAMGAAFSG